MKLAAVTLLGRLALGDPAPEPPPDHRHLVLHAGEQAPTDGLFADELMARYDLERLRYLEAELAACKDVAEQQGQGGVAPYIIGGALGIAVGVVAGVLAAKAVTK